LDGGGISLTQKHTHTQQPHKKSVFILDVIFILSPCGNFNLFFLNLSTEKIQRTSVGHKSYTF